MGDTVVGALDCFRLGCKSNDPIGIGLFTYPKNPDLSYGNTRPSVHDTPFQGLKTTVILTPRLTSLTDF